MFHRRRSKNPHVVALSMPPFVCRCCVLIAVILVPVWLFSRRSSIPPQTPGETKHLFARKHLGKSAGNHRLAIIIPFVGEGPEVVPPYLELFCSAAAGSAGLVDFLLIHSGVLDGYHGDNCPSNVRFISLLTIEDFAKHLVRVVDHKTDQEIALGGSRDLLAKILAKHVIKYPYVLVEFKPALGHIFSGFLEGYTHWGYSDLDILFGDLERWITPDELNDFDIVTYGYGDQDRIYLRGQFTFHKNDDKINQLWRHCDYLVDMDKRFNEVMSGDQHLHFESAEGCYSAAVLQHKDIKIKYTVKAFTDIDTKDTAYSHGLYVGTGNSKSRTVIYKARSQEDGKALQHIPSTWFESKDTLYSDPTKPLLFEVGERERLPTLEKPDAKCMFWAQKKYQTRLCLDNVQPTDTVYWIDGQLYKQKYELAKLPGGLVTAPFFHFQEYKRYYRTTQLSGFHREGPVRTFLLAKEGVLPIYPSEFKNDRSFLPSPLGVPLRAWKGVRAGFRQQLPNRSYCLRSGPRKFPPKPPAPQCYFATSWRDAKTIEIISGAPAWNQMDVESDVTMVLTLQLQPSQVSSAESVYALVKLIAIYLDRWQGQPSVVVLHVPSATKEVAAMLRIKFGPGSDLSLFELDTCFVGVLFTESDHVLSRKALLNMAIDMVPTRWFVSGFELERGLLISQDAAFFANRAALTHKELNGSIFVVPQFGLVGKESDYTLPTLWNDREEDTLQPLAQLDASGCEVSEDAGTDDQSGLFGAINKAWWTMSEPYIAGRPVEKSTDQVHELRAKVLEDIQMDVMKLLTDKRQYSLFAMDVSPILMVDNKGPHHGMKASEIAREVEELGGTRCYNGLRLAQLATLGYHVGILAGAFALSTPNTREIVATDPFGQTNPIGTSRCDGCFLFDEKHEDILEKIAIDERKRPAKAVLLCDYPTTVESVARHA